jgi:hypothetical protein
MSRDASGWMRRSSPILSASKFRGRVRARLLVQCAFLSLIAFSVPAAAKVFSSQQQALREAFPEATRIERDSRIVLSDELERIRELSGQTDLPRVVVLHTAWQGDRLLGHAHIDVHTVRTKPEAFMIVLTPEGSVRSVRVLAFHEPLDYLPTERWYAQFEGRTRADPLRVGGDVHGVVGATLSARAAADGVRRVLAYWAVLIEPAGARPSSEKEVTPAGAPISPSPKPRPPTLPGPPGDG